MTADIHLVRDYPHPRAKVWRALTDPALMPLWGMRPDGFAPVVGTRFRLVGQANPHWRGFIDCEVTQASPPSVIAYTWVDNDGAQATHISYRLEETPGGTRLTVEHDGFTAAGRADFVDQFMRPGLEAMVDNSLPAVLGDLTDEGMLRAGSTLKPRY
jgi:uncharacterized protein YndB with AHSA1/START domain